MKLSIEWLREYVPLPENLDPSQLAHDLTMSTVEVEHVDDLRTALVGVIVAEVQSCGPHPDTDSLVVCVMHDSRTVVCGGRNVAAGMKVALALPGAIVRSRDGGHVEISEASVRGISSSGMLCSPGELGLSELFPAQDNEILDLAMLNAVPGTPLARAIGYDDVIIEIDNKSLTHRPDLWCHYGIARELAAIYNLPLRALPVFDALISDGDRDFEVRVGDPRCLRYAATRIDGVDQRPSPMWLQARLTKVGQRPINLLVDLTNYVMMAIGQPAHAFDARDLPGGVEVRAANDGETLTLLDGTELVLDSRTLVIASHKGAIALAGIMGGELGVRSDTTAIWLELASFDAVDVRRTARRFGLRTESSTRFEKGVDTPRVCAGLAVFQNLLAQLIPEARIVVHLDVHLRPTLPVTVQVDLDFLHRRLGRELPASAVSGLLGRLGFETEGIDTLIVHVPSWRATGDVDLPEDIVEEVGRLYGFEALGFSPPVVALERPVHQPRRRMERQLKEVLAFRCDLHEVVTYPWVSDSLLWAADVADLPTLGLALPPSPGMRLAPSLIPGLIDVIVNNLRFQEQFGVFELNRVFRPATVEDREGLPAQPRHLAAAVVGDDASDLFYRAKGILEKLAAMVQCEAISLTPAPQAALSWADPAAVLVIKCRDRKIGSLGILSARNKRLAGIKRGEVALFEFNVDALEPHASREHRYVPLLAHPQVDFDISVVVPLGARWADLLNCASTASSLVRGVSFVDEYTGEQVPAGRKSVTLRLHLGATDRTLIREEINAAAARVIASLGETFGGLVRSR